MKISRITPAAALLMCFIKAVAQQPTIHLDRYSPAALLLFWEETDPTFLVEVNGEIGQTNAWLPLPALPLRDDVGPYFALDPREGDPNVFFRLREDRFPVSVAVTAPEPGTVRVTWDFTYKDYVLEGSADAVNWTPVALAPRIVGDKFVLDLPVFDAHQFYRIRSNRPPTLSAPITATVNIGESRQFTIVASDPDGDRLQFQITGLPDGAAFDPSTGLLTITPGPGQVGVFDIVITATDGFAGATRVFRVTVPPLPMRTTAALRGRILDANSAAQGQTVPIPNVRVTLLTTSHATMTDGGGHFMLDGVPAGLQVLNLDPTMAGTAPDGSAYGGFREEVTLLPQTENVINRPLYLPRIAMGSMTPVNPAGTTLVTNAAIGVGLTIPPNTAMAGGSIVYDGPISISEVPLGYAPAAMPEELQPSVVITLQPVGVSFAQPVPITFPNRNNLEPNSEVDIWSLDAGTGMFVVVGVGKVSSDGMKIETISGGVRATDWHFPLPVPPSTEPTDDDHGKGTPCPGGSSVLLHNGVMLTDVALPSYFSLGKERVFRLNYSSRQAEPFALISANFTQPGRQPRPRYLALATEADGVRSEQRWFSFLGAPSTDAAWVSPVSLLEQSTGIRSVSIRAGYRWTGGTGTASATRTGVGDVRTGVVNRRNSPYGAGWSIGGLQRIYPDGDATRVLLVEDVHAAIFDRGLSLDSIPLFEQGRALPFPDSSSTIPTYGIASGDFNGDGARDLAVAKSAVNQGIYIFAGNSNGTFRSLLNVPVSGGQVSGLVSADFDRDGIADLAVGTLTTRRVVIFKGIGNGNFTQSDSFTLTIRTEALYAADVDGNNSLDLVTVTDGTGSSADLVVLLNNGSGSFSATPAQDPFGNTTYLCSALADINGDNRPDVVLGTFPGSGSVQVALNDGSGQFNAATPFPGGGGVTALACADFTGDHQIDVLAGSNTRCTLYRNTGGGMLVADAGPAFSFPGGPVRNYTDSTPSDLDGDGKMDVVFGSEANFVLVAYGNGMGSFAPRAFAMFPGPAELDEAPVATMNGVLAADFNGDGFVELVATALGTRLGAAVVLGKGPRDFVAPRSFTSLNASSTSRNSAAGDFDRDGIPDLMLLAQTGDSVLEFSKGLGNGTFAPHVPAMPESAVPGSGGENLRVADFDRDGNLDVIFSRGAPSRTIITWGLGNGMFKQDLGGDSNVWVVTESGPSGNLPPVNIIPGDFNRDGFVDYANVFVDRVSIHLHNIANPRTFIVAAHVIVPFAGDIADGAATGFLNADANLDLFLVERRPGDDAGTLFYAVYAGNGDGSFTRVVQDFAGFTQGFTPGPGQNLIPREYDVGMQSFREALLSDVNKDGFVDALFTSGNGAWLMTGDGQGRLNPPTVVTRGFFRPAGPMALIDVDDDGFDELAVGQVDIFSRGVAVLPNIGGRQVFDEPIRVATPAPVTRGLHGFDADRDGKADLIVHHGESGLNTDQYTFAVLRNIVGTTTATNGFEGQFTSPVGDFTRLRINQDGTFTRTYPDGTVVQFDTNGLHRTTTDRNGNVTRYEYVAPGSDMLARIIEPDGRQVTLSYLNERLASISTPAGVTRLTFEADEPPSSTGPNCAGGENRLKTVTLPGGGTRQFTYLNYREPPPRIIASRPANRHAGFSPAATAVGVISPCNGLRKTGLIVDEIDGEGNISTHSYDHGRLRYAQLPEGLNRQFTSPLQGISASLLDTNTLPEFAIPAHKPTDRVGSYVEGSRVTTYRTGPDGKVTEFYEGLIKTTMDRDGNGLLTRLRLPSGHQLTMSYDGAGNVLTIDDNQAGTTAFEYDPLFNQVTKVVHPQDVGAETRFDYDLEGNLTRIVTPEGRSVSARYDGNGQLVAATNALGLSAVLEYSQGRMDRIRAGSGPQQRTATAQYDGAGRLVLVQDAEGRPTGFDYFASGVLRSITWPGGGVNTLERDQNQDVTAITLPSTAGTARHRWTRDGLGRVVRYAPPEVPAVDFNYNVHSQLTEFRAAGERLLELSYNGRGQLANVSLTRLNMSPLTVTNTFNDTTSSLLTRSVCSDGVTLVPTYAGNIPRRMQWSGAVVGTYAITFDERYRITSAQINGDAPTVYTYDQDNLLLTAGDLALTRHSTDSLVSQVHIGVLTEMYSYNAFGELTNHTATAGDTGLFSAQYERDKLGRATHAVESVNGITTTFDYEYDDAGRLVRVLANGAVRETYSYDPRGNIISDSHNGAYTFNAADQVLSAGSALLAYTDDGTLRTTTRGGETRTHSYTASSHLRRVDSSGGWAIEYLHDGMLNRAIKTSNGVVVAKYLCPNGSLPIATLDPANQVVSHFVYGTRVNMPEYFVKNGVTYRIIGDQIGSARLIVDVATGNVVQQLAYDAYGRILEDTAPGFQPFGFAGGLYDPDTGLVRFGMRDYDPELRHWTSRDPVFFPGAAANLYSYANNDPINYIDPLGLNPSRFWDRVKGVGAILGGVAAIGAGIALAPIGGAGMPLVGAFLIMNGLVAIGGGTANLVIGETKAPTSIAEGVTVGASPSVQKTAKVFDLGVGLLAPGSNVKALETMGDVADTIDAADTIYGNVNEVRQQLRRPGSL